MVNEKGSDRIRPEWIPSAYREVTKTDKTDNVKIDNGKPTLYSHKGVFIRYGFKRIKR